MADHHTHDNHTHTHGPNCGHTAVKHGDHVDYVHDGHMHQPHGDHCDEHKIEVSDRNPNSCTTNHSCGGHDSNHKHGAGCGHEAVPHGDHADHIVNGHLHHAHGDHCDDHGSVDIVK